MNERYKSELISIIHKHLPGCMVYLFGSRARCTNREGADIDLAIDAGEKVDFRKLLAIKADIEETTIPLFVDLVDMHAIDDSFKEEIMKDAISWDD